MASIEQPLAFPGSNHPAVDFQCQTPLPLVSVIIRSMDRKLLGEALDSVASQSYPHIEILVVNAKGAEHSELPVRCGRFPIRFIPSDHPLDRSRAANTGLESASGEYLIFLDDDDIFYPNHIASLVESLHGSGQARCTYAGVRVEYYVDGQLTGEMTFNEPFHRMRLWGRNFIPIHAVLFERSLYDEGCRFDETLNILEDWDFWVQLSQHTEFVHLDQISACYRNFGGSGLGESIPEEYLRTTTGLFFEKWKSIWSGEQWAEIILYRDSAKERSERLAAVLQTQIAQQTAELDHDKLLIATLRDRLAELEIMLNQSDARTITLQQHLEMLYRSKSWKITAPLRFLSRPLRDRYREAWTGLRRLLRLPDGF